MNQSNIATSETQSSSHTNEQIAASVFMLVCYHNNETIDPFMNFRADEDFFIDVIDCVDATRLLLLHYDQHEDPLITYYCICWKVSNITEAYLYSNISLSNIKSCKALVLLLCHFKCLSYDSVMDTGARPNVFTL